MLLKIELIHLSDSGKGLVDHIEEYYVPEEEMRVSYDFSKDLPQDVSIFFKGSSVELGESGDAYSVIIKLPHRKPIKLAMLQEDEYEDRVYVELLKDKLSLRFTLLCNYIEVYNSLTISKGSEAVKFSPTDFKSDDKISHYPNSEEVIPWLDGYKLIEFDEEKVLLINPQKDIIIQLDGDHPSFSIEGIRFELSSYITKIHELNPITKKLYVYYVDTPLFYESYADMRSAYRLACEIQKQYPEAKEIIVKYMTEAAGLDSFPAKRWLEAYHKRRELDQELNGDKLDK